MKHFINVNPSTEYPCKSRISYEVCAYPSCRTESNCLLLKRFTSPCISTETSSKSSHDGISNKFSTANGFRLVDADASLISWTAIGGGRFNGKVFQWNKLFSAIFWILSTSSATSGLRDEVSRLNFKDSFCKVYRIISC